MKLFVAILTLSAFLPPQFAAADSSNLLRVGVVGLSHDHVHAVLRRHAEGNLQIVGIAESNRKLIQRHAQRYGFSQSIVFDSIEEMLDDTKPEVVSDYGSIFGHL